MTIDSAIAPTVQVDDWQYRVVDVKPGGMGRVFILQRTSLEPWDPVYRTRVAVKTFSTSDLTSTVDSERVRNELNVWISLTHWGIVPLSKVVHMNLGIGALMPAYSGNLVEEISQRGPHDGERAASIAHQLCAALNHAFTVNAVLHLDLKPANVLTEKTVDGATVYRISDWGIASIQRELADSLRVPGHSKLVDYTHTYNSFGTLPYMAPERFLQSVRATVQCDIYSVGMLLYQLLTGRPPAIRNAEEHVDLLMSGRLLDGMVRELAVIGCQPRLIGVIAGCLIPDPAARFSTYAQVIDALRHSAPLWRRFRLTRRVHG